MRTSECELTALDSRHDDTYHDARAHQINEPAMSDYADCICREERKERLMKDRPNILLIITEQHRGDCLSCEGHPVLLTPNMDNIACNGARFSRFYSDCPVCMPARRTILAGQFPATHGLLANVEGVQWRPQATLPQALRDHGYQTRWIGRGMHQYPVRARFGYDEVESGGGRHDDDYMLWLKARAPEDCGTWFGAGVMHNDWTARPWPLPEYLHNTNWTFERALNFMRRRDPTCPFFLTLSFLAAHPPLQPPEVYFNRYLRTGVPEPFVGDWAEPPEECAGGDVVAPNRIRLQGEALLNTRAGYYGLINHLDDQLRRLINNVTGLSQRKDTIICLTSDHGEMLGDHYRWRKSVGYEGSARVPLLLSAPQEMGVEPGTVVDAPATLADVMPTLLDMAGVDVPDTVDGESLWPVMRGDAPPEREFVHFEHAGVTQALTDGREKYIWNPVTGREQLFDLNADPHELRDCAAEPDGAARIVPWRRRLIERLKDRPEGFTDGERLIPGLPRVGALDHAGEREPFQRRRFHS